LHIVADARYLSHFGLALRCAGNCVLVFASKKFSHARRKTNRGKVLGPRSRRGQRDAQTRRPLAAARGDVLPLSIFGSLRACALSASPVAKLSVFPASLMFQVNTLLLFTKPNCNDIDSKSDHLETAGKCTRAPGVQPRIRTLKFIVSNVANLCLHENHRSPYGPNLSHDCSRRLFRCSKWVVLSRLIIRELRQKAPGRLRG